MAEASDYFENRTVAFLEWFQNLTGSNFSDALEIVDLTSRNAGRGIVAKRDIPADTTLFTIPRTAILSNETSPLKGKVPQLFESRGDQDHEQALDSWTALILMLMHEYMCGSGSPWMPYLNVLPETFDTPMFWSADELSHLQASRSLLKIGRANAEATFHMELVPRIRANADAFPSSRTYGDGELVQLAHRMGSTIMAYAFDLENDDGDDEDGEDGWVEDRDGRTLMGMVPMADMLNADAEFNAHVNHGDDALTVTSLRDIKAGEEILNYYGPHPNSELLRRYGYVTERHARYDVVEIPWEKVLSAVTAQLGVPSAQLDKAMEEMDQDELEDVFVLERDAPEPSAEGTFTDPATVDPIPSELKDQLKSLVKHLQKLDGNLIPDKRKRDGAISGITAQALREILAGYKTTLAEDEEICHRSGLTPRQKMAMTVRMGEKKLITEALKALENEDEPEGGNKRARRE